MRTITFIDGDGVGPSLAEVARKCIDATGVKIEWEVVQAGDSCMEQYGTPLPDNVLDSIKKNKIAIKSPITTPIGKGFRSVNVHLRKELDLFACLRPCKLYPGVNTYFSETAVDLVIVRENTEDLYAGIEFDLNTPELEDVHKVINKYAKKPLAKDAAISIKPISVSGTERIVRYAFEYAKMHNRRKVTAVTKANIMKYTDGLFIRVASKVAQDYPNIEYEEVLVDALCMQLVKFPERYDVLVLPNLYGDIISDLCAGLVGGLGMSPGANIGDDIAMFEATHGSAPKKKGLNKVNPTALLLSGVMMLRHINEIDAADCLEKAIKDVISEKKYVTYDLKSDGDSFPPVGTKEMGDAIVDRINASL